MHPGFTAITHGNIFFFFLKRRLKSGVSGRSGDVAKKLDRKVKRSSGKVSMQMCFFRFTIYVCVDISRIMYISASPVPAIVLWLPRGARWPRCLPLLATTLRRLQGFLFQMNRWKWVLLQLHKPLIRLDLGHSCRQFLSLPCVIVKRKKKYLCLLNLIIDLARTTSSDLLDLGRIS